LRTGRVWYSPGSPTEGDTFEGWDALIGDIKKGTCTPILGPDLVESVLGSAREYARSLADKFRFPLAPQDREQMHLVSQYVQTNQRNTSYVRDKFLEWVKTQALAWLRRHAAAGLDKDHEDDLTADEAVRQVGWHLQQLGPQHPYNVLAGLPLPCYISTTPDGLLEEALRAAGKSPQVDYCR